MRSSTRRHGGRGRVPAGRRMGLPANGVPSSDRRGRSGTRGMRATCMARRTPPHPQTRPPEGRGGPPLQRTRPPRRPLAAGRPPRRAGPSATSPSLAAALRPRNIPVSRRRGATAPRATAGPSPRRASTTRRRRRRGHPSPGRRPPPWRWSRPTRLPATGLHRPWPRTSGPRPTSPQPPFAGVRLRPGRRRGPSAPPLLAPAHPSLVVGPACGRPGSCPSRATASGACCAVSFCREPAAAAPPLLGVAPPRGCVGPKERGWLPPPRWFSSPRRAAGAPTRRRTPEGPCSGSWRAASRASSQLRCSGSYPHRVRCSACRRGPWRRPRHRSFLRWEHALWRPPGTAWASAFPPTPGTSRRPSMSAAGWSSAPSRSCWPTPDGHPWCRRLPVTGAGGRCQVLRPGVITRQMLTSMLRRQCAAA